MRVCAQGKGWKFVTFCACSLLCVACVACVACLAHVALGLFVTFHLEFHLIRKVIALSLWSLLKWL